MQHFCVVVGRCIWINVWHLLLMLVHLVFQSVLVHVPARARSRVHDLDLVRPGSCPASCDTSSTAITGSYVFAPESGICKAALLSKVLGLDGGDVVVTVGFGQNAYFGSSGGSVVSKDGGVWHAFAICACVCLSFYACVFVCVRV